jgi:predicted nuclease of predicted toxin-antitoxin system
VKLLLDEMYPATLAEGLSVAGIEPTTVAALKLAGSSDAEVFAAAVAGGHVLVTEKVGDFTRIAAERGTAGGTTTGC